MSIYEAKTNLSKLVALVSEGDDVLITNRGVVVAQLSAPASGAQTGFGVLSDQFGDFDWDAADADFQNSFSNRKSF